jgi:hypothetical protein
MAGGVDAALFGYDFCQKGKGRENDQDAPSEKGIRVSLGGV